MGIIYLPYQIVTTATIVSDRNGITRIGMLSDEKKSEIKDVIRNNYFGNDMVTSIDIIEMHDTIHIYYIKEEDMGVIDDDDATFRRYRRRKRIKISEVHQFIREEKLKNILD